MMRFVHRLIDGCLRALLRPNAVEHDLDVELRAYLDTAVQQKTTG